MKEKGIKISRENLIRKYQVCGKKVLIVERYLLIYYDKVMEQP